MALYEEKEEIEKYIRGMFALVAEAPSHYERFGHYSYVSGVIVGAFRCWGLPSTSCVMLEKELKEVHEKRRKELDELEASR